ncbi:hypothetical protein [Terriglobus sp. TAA 43]|uniref:hypothetical protein n=1 Tax=Terriglobus sp. TAA 43 TaxID=278961 RepID=UPI0012ED885A|nr:hypothetical protein [Terriglobus sp. TAA 43]
MPDSKIEIKVGAVSFSGEGPGEWLSKQLDKVLAKLPELTQIVGSEDHSSDHSTDRTIAPKRHNNSNVTLAAFLKEKKATSNQVRKFLATSVWLHDHEGKGRVTTNDVTTALNSHNQGKLTNPTQCLNRNVGKGHAVKDGSQFYVSDDGRTELGN